MKKLIETIKNIFKIEELRKRIVYTILLLLVYRLGSYVVLPGIDPTQLDQLQSQASEGLLGLLNMFSGGAFGNASIFALGVMPYISASIVIQLLGIMIPYFQRLQREGESGRRKDESVDPLPHHCDSGAAGTCLYGKPFTFSFLRQHSFSKDLHLMYLQP